MSDETPPPFDRGFLEHAAKARSQYDSTCRTMARQILDGMDRLTTAEAEVTRLRAALERIAAYETDWTVGPAANVNALQLMAERALSATPAVPMTLDPGTVSKDFCEGRDAALANAAMVAWDMGHPDVRHAINQLFPEDSPARPIDTPTGLPRYGAVCGDAIEALALPQTAEPTPAKVCAEWCGTRTKEHDYGAHASEYWYRRKMDDRCFCSPACSDAGKPLNPRGTGRSPEETR